MTILTAQNQTTTIEPISSGYNCISDLWQIVFIEKTHSVDPPKELVASRPITLSIQNIPEQPVYENDVQVGTTPAENKLDEWLTTWNGMEELKKASLKYIIETRSISTWQDPADSIANEAELLTGPWTQGEFVKKGWVREYEGISYSAKQQHTCKLPPVKDTALWLGPDGEANLIESIQPEKK